MATTTRTITIPHELNPVSVLGPGDSVLRRVEAAFPQVDIVARGDRLAVLSRSRRTEPDAIKAADLLRLIIRMAYAGPVDADAVERMLSHASTAWAADTGVDAGAGVDAGIAAAPLGAAPVGVDSLPGAVSSVSSVSSGLVGSAGSAAPTVGSAVATVGSAAPTVGSAAPTVGSAVATPATAPIATAAGRTKPHGRSYGPHGGGLSRKAFEGVSGTSPDAYRAGETLAFALGRPVRAKTDGQVAYMAAVSTHTITFAIGPAGTGKTFLAVAKAVQAFQSKRVSRIILTRPAVEAGENLGFLPGSLNEKVDPYLRPLYDALSQMLGADRLHRFMAEGIIEVAPLAYMRGRTLNDAFVILDEAQNTTEQQMKMFLTRLGWNTTMVVTGDVTQIDLAVPRSGLAGIERILSGVDGIAFVHLDAGDVVRHRLVGDIIAAYDRWEAGGSRGVDGGGRGGHGAARRLADPPSGARDAGVNDLDGKERGGDER